MLEDILEVISITNATSIPSSQTVPTSIHPKTIFGGCSINTVKVAVHCGTDESVTTTTYTPPASDDKFCEVAVNPFGPVHANV